VNAAGFGMMAGMDSPEPVEPESPVPAHPNAPRRGPVLLAYLLVVTAGALGALIGVGLARASCSEDPSVLERLLTRVDGFETGSRSCASTTFITALGAAAIAAVGAGVVAVLVLRAMAEWRAHPPRPGDGSPDAG
jgi:hypothetical protein